MSDLGNRSYMLGAKLITSKFFHTRITLFGIMKRQFNGTIFLEKQLIHVGLVKAVTNVSILQTKTIDLKITKIPLCSDIF